jgi:hypothetical protein
MKRPALAIGIFSLAFLTGIAASLYYFRVISDSAHDHQTILSLETDVPAFETDFRATFDPEIDYSERLNVKLIETGNFFFKNAPNQTGENWLALFRTENGYELAPTKIKVIGGMYRQISTLRDDETIFLLRDFNLNGQSVATVFDHKTSQFSLGQDRSKSLILDGVGYELRVENGRNGYLRDGAAITLKSAGKRQVLRAVDEQCDSCSWELLWAGDLDGDNKLDLFLDVSPSYLFVENVLFLSSVARSGEMVGILAARSGPGC